MIIGTAGHIDHGKTALVGALTGMDTDRLAEEKRRGISIDLGFAHVTLPDGQTISFIDVPGHERFIRNMLAGAVGIQAVLLIIAADESVKPQTREHFEICRLLGIRDGMIVLTKIDIASSEQIQIAGEEARALCAGSFLEGAAMVPVSARTGEGLDDLRSELSRLAARAQPRSDKGFARLPVDRSFTLRGFGTVVTGTLWSGRLSAGEMAQLHPSRREIRIRGLQVHGKPVEIALAGQRTAVNLSGIESSEIRRGHVLTHSGGLETTQLMDVSLEWLKGFAVPQNRQQVLLHIGTAEVFATLKVLRRGAEGCEALARLWLAEPLLAIPGDRFVLRRPSPAHTVAGGTVIDAFPPRRVNRAKQLLRLHELMNATPDKRVQILVEERENGIRLSDLVRSTGLGEPDLRSIVTRNPALLMIEAAQCVVSGAWLAGKREELVQYLTRFHSQNPAALGAPVAHARLGLDPHLATRVFQDFPSIRQEGDVVALTTHKPRLGNRELELRAKLEDLFRKAGFQPPSLSEALSSAAADPKEARAQLEGLIKSKTLVRISSDLIFHTDTIAQIRNSLAAHKGRRFSVPDFKESTQISRKYAIPLLEYLDRVNVTRREGDMRVVL
ncbi:MAG: selenocysteine-specific translation elongation factor [Acidobacteriaceae bacterium]|nr:selenocysteine-specific translation elongation factor [Acidobacteriaceae bacterium]MBV9779972.1 selenocysteine-specific translation elongation factor [Acidobacteriaceae bacterium]